MNANHCFKARIRPSMIGFDVIEGQAKLDQFVDYVICQAIHGIHATISMNPTNLKEFFSLNVNKAQLGIEQLFS